MKTCESDKRLSGVTLAVSATILTAVNFALRWPGTLTPDSEDQLSQVLTGSFTDWHPPLMATLWALLGGRVQAMLLLQIGLHWFGFWALAETLRRGDSGRLALAMLAIGFSPIAIVYTGVVQKDTLLASFFIAAFGLAALTRSSAIPGILGAAGALCRVNGTFALPPLFLSRGTCIRLPLTIGLCLIFAVALVPISQIINHNLLQARRTGVERSLQLFDLVGIAYFARDASVLPENARSAAACYTPLFWDTLPTPRCAGSLNDLPISLSRAWMEAIAIHPIAYVRHRLAHFNSTTFFIVPPMQQCVEAPSFHVCNFTKTGKLIDFLTKNALLWPATWLTAAIFCIFVKLNPVSAALNLSALLYGLAYLVVGVATDFRYFYWTELAVQAALAYELIYTGRLAYWRAMAASIAVIWIIGYSARFAML